MSTAPLFANYFETVGIANHTQNKSLKKRRATNISHGISIEGIRLCASKSTIQCKCISAAGKLCTPVNVYPKIEYTVQRKGACDT